MNNLGITEHLVKETLFCETHASRASLGLAVTTLRFTLIVDLGGDQHYRNEIEDDLIWEQLHCTRG